MTSQTLKTSNSVGPDLTLRHKNPHSVAEHKFSSAGFKQHKQLMKLICNLFLLLIIANSAFANDITRIGRYSTVENEASIAQINPLMAVGQFRFQPNVVTIGDAINQVLQNTSYKLVPNKLLPPIARETLSKTLPITVRTLGPICIKEAVLVLMGNEVFDLVIDPAHRLINFRVKKNIARILGVSYGSH